MKIATFVIIDLETTGLPHLENNRTKITEICLLAAFRKDIRNTVKGKVPPIAKLTFNLNPERKISSTAEKITGIKSEQVKYAQTFKEKIKTINSFLEDLRKPVCLVAHNGNTFDYRILLAECADINLFLPDDLLCVDSLPIFRKILKAKKSDDVIDKGVISNPRATTTKINKSMNSTKSTNDSEIMTDDEDEWPDLNATPEELQEIDELCSSFDKMTATQKKTLKQPRESFKLTEIYKRCFGKVDFNAHQAEDDCLMLLKCMVFAQDQSDLDFLKIADTECKLLKDCKAIERK